MIQKPAKSAVSKLLLAVLLMGNLAGSPPAMADDADLQMSTSDGTTQIGFQNSSGTDVVTVSSLGTVAISSNTILPGTTFYQNGNVRMGVTGSSIAFFGATPAPQQPSATHLENALLSFGFYSSTASVPFNTGTGNLSQGVAATALAGGNFAISAAGLVTKSDGITAAGIGLPVIVSTSIITGQAANLGPIVLYTATAGQYFRISFYMVCMTTLTGGANVQLNAIYEDVSQASLQTVAVPGGSLGNTAGNYAQGDFYLESKAAAVEYSVTGYGSGGTYNIYLSIERLN